MTKPNMVLATVVARNGLFYDSVLHQPGESIWVDLDKLGIKSLDESRALVPADDQEAISTMAIASVAPRAPGATMPQGLPSGTVHSGTGRFLSRAGGGENAGSIEVRPDTGADELTPDVPIRRDTDIDAEAMDQDPEPEPAKGRKAK